MPYIKVGILTFHHKNFKIYEIVIHGFKIV